MKWLRILELCLIALIFVATAIVVLGIVEQISNPVGQSERPWSLAD